MNREEILKEMLELAEKIRAEKEFMLSAEERLSETYDKMAKIKSPIVAEVYANPEYKNETMRENKLKQVLADNTEYGVLLKEVRESKKKEAQSKITIEFYEMQYKAYKSMALIML